MEETGWECVVGDTVGVCGGRQGRGDKVGMCGGEGKAGSVWWQLFTWYRIENGQI